MWIEPDGSESTPPVDLFARRCLDVGPAPLNRAGISVEKILRTYSHTSCENGTLKVQSIYWRNRFWASIYGGLFPCITDNLGLLLHMMGYLSTDKRDLSTKSLSEQQLYLQSLPHMCLPA